ncbi:VIT and VWA domain-containing protein [Desulfobacterales bacterium HSG17]|nr:VIT and VWA domain-containing protein [Desulfobacterales bacterium HSG17]
MKSIMNYFKKLGNGLAAITLAAALCFVMIQTNTANSAGLLIADGGFGGVLEIKEHDVKVVINNGVAVTHVTQVFHNTENRQVEALYTFPVPKGASVANFSMWINGKEMVGEVLEKQRAREIYNSYKRKRQDPGLLEQKDYKTFEMRIYPINPNADQKVQISYYQEMEIDHDRAVYVYPLGTVTREDINSQTTGRFAINAEIKSAIPITSVESPSHKDSFVVADHSDTFKLASLETSGGSLGADVVISYNLARAQTGFDLITSKQGNEDGFFYLTLTTGRELKTLDTGMDFVFLMDISGSMENDRKLIISRNSLEAFVDELGQEDRFEVMAFNVNAETVFGELRPGTDEMKGQAKAFMGSKSARGGTVLSPAMTTAYKYGDPDRTLNVVILSDGMTEQGERQTLMQLIASRPQNARVFCIGVGNEVNRPLLEQLAEDSGGLASFISRGDNFKLQAKGFRRKLMHPVATDLEIDFRGIQVYDVEPQKLPNLYHGSPIRIYGRYKGDGEAEITLNGNVQGIEMKQAGKMVFPEIDSDNPEIERMWAWKRVDRLLKQADRTNSRNTVVNEIVALAEDYSIVTEYTSFLVLENDAEYKRWKIERRNMNRIGRDRNAQEKRKKQMENIRSKAVQAIGPQPELKKITARQPVSQRIASAPRQAPGNNSPAIKQQPKKRRQSMDFNFGGGPVGPLFVGLAYWLRRRKNKA